MRTDLAPGVVQVDLSTDDKLSQETNTALVELSLRVDLNGDPDVIQKIVDAMREALQPFTATQS